MILEIGGLKVLAEAITGIQISEKDSYIYTTGGAIPVTQTAAKAIAEAWEEFEESTGEDVEDE